MAKPNTRATLISYCKRALGHPVIEINVDDDQVDDRIDEALQFYQEYHSDAIETTFLKHLPTVTDIANGYITIPDLVTNVKRVFPLDETVTNASMFDIKYQIHLNDIYSLGYMGSLVNYEISKQWLAMIDIIIDNDDHHYDFNRHRNTLRIDMDWEKDIKNPTVTDVAVSAFGGNFGIQGEYNKELNIDYGATHVFDLSQNNMAGHTFKLSTTADGTHGGGSEYTTGVVVTGTPGQTGAKLEWTPAANSDGEYIDKTLYYYCGNHSGMGGKINLRVDSQYVLMECTRILEPTTYTDIYNDQYLKKYATALIKRQWGANLIKFEGMVMPGGVTFNGRQLFDDANEEILKLEEEARLNWEDPIDFMTG